MNKYYAFIVDTDSYSGNFEREMGAYLTGQIGDCEVGSDLLGLFYEDMKENGTEEYIDLFDEIVYQKPDENGFRRPVEIETTPNRVNNGMGLHLDKDSDEAKALPRTYGAYESVAIFFSVNPTEHAEFLKKRAYEFETIEKLKVKGFRIQKIETTVETSIVDL